MSQKTALIMAGGTGGHIFPGLAVAEELRARGWRVHWLGAPGSMESRIVPQHGFPLELIDFSGVRGKGLATLALLPLRLLRAFWQALQVVRRVKPDVVVGLGGYITFPGGMMGVLCGKPLVLHEQNSVAGMANKVLAGVADRVFTAFPQVLKKAQWVGNPLRTAFTRQGDPAVRRSVRRALHLARLVGRMRLERWRPATPTARHARRGSDAGPAARIAGGASSRTARLAGGEAGSRTRSGGGDRRADLRLVAALATAGSPA